MERLVDFATLLFWCGGGGTLGSNRDEKYTMGIKNLRGVRGLFHIIFIFITHDVANITIRKAFYCSMIQRFGSGFISHYLITHELFQKKTDVHTHPYKPVRCQHEPALSVSYRITAQPVTHAHHYTKCASGSYP